MRPPVIINLRSFNVGMICNVTGAVCHGKVCGCALCWLSEIIIAAPVVTVFIPVLQSRVASMQIVMT